jgi:hypothetical protein
MTARQNSEILSLILNPDVRKVMIALSRREITLVQLCLSTELSEIKIRQIMSHLERLNFIKSQKTGRDIKYLVNQNGVNEVMKIQNSEKKSIK